MTSSPSPPRDGLAAFRRRPLLRRWNERRRAPLLRQPAFEERPLRRVAVAARGDTGELIAAPPQRPAAQIVSLEGEQHLDADRHPARELPARVLGPERP